MNIKITLTNKQKSRFLSRIYTNPKMETKHCWIWKGNFGSNGYGQISLNDKTISAHRVSYLIFKGDLIDGLVIDHICRNIKCVNPFHLRQITNSENIYTENSMAVINRNKKYCSRGHKFKGVSEHGKHRFCIPCAYVTKNKWRNSMYKNDSIYRETIKKHEREKYHAKLIVN